MSHIRIESHEKVVTNAKIFFVDGDEETDISSCMQVVDIHLGVAEVATVTLQGILGSASVSAEVKDIVMNRLKPRSTSKRWHRRLQDFTRFGSRRREYA